MKTITFLSALILFTINGFSQKIKPCEEWLSDFIQVQPKVENGLTIDNYVTQKLTGDTSLKEMATCMIGLKIYSNCKGEFSYEKQDYRNNPHLIKQCQLLLKKTESIMNGVKTLEPGMIANQKKDFTFKLVVKVKGDGTPVAEILYQ